VPAAAIPPELEDDAFRGSAAVRAGLLTNRQLDGPSWRRLFRDVYVPAGLPVTHELRARAATLLLPDAVVTGRSAAVLWGVDVAGTDDEVELTLPPGANPRRVRGLTVRRAVLPRAQLWSRRSVRVTTVEATALRLAALLPGDDAVVAVDQLLGSRVIDLEPVRRLAGAASGPGSARARTVLALADALAESPQETRLRLLIARSPLPQPVAQFRVRAGDHAIARVDFAWPDRQVAVEYDGLWHAEPGQFAKDRHRLNALQAAGWRVVFVTAADLHRPAELLGRIAAALVR